MLPVKGLLMDGYWIGVQDGDLRARALFRKHYSHRRYKDGRGGDVRLVAGEWVDDDCPDCGGLGVRPGSLAYWRWQTRIAQLEAAAKPLPF